MPPLSTEEYNRRSTMKKKIVIISVCLIMDIYINEEKSRGL